MQLYGSADGAMLELYIWIHYKKKDSISSKKDFFKKISPISSWSGESAYKKDSLKMVLCLIDFPSNQNLAASLSWGRLLEAIYN